MVDELIVSANEKAARSTVAIVTPIIGLTSFLFFALGRRVGEELVWAGMVLSYVTLFILAVHSFSYYLVMRRYTGNEE